MARAKMPHTGHYHHLCYLTNINYNLFNPKQYKALVKNAKFLCRVCGRVDVSDKNLCKPVKL